MSPLLKQLFNFAHVGLMAACVHYICVLLLTYSNLLHPLIANVIGFICAFWVSYIGHRHLSFKAQHLAHRTTLPRFALVALFGFMLNQTALFAMLKWTNISVGMGLPIIIIGVAAVTFLLSKKFAFFQ